MAIERQKPIAIEFDGMAVGEACADLVVEGRLLIEIKSVDRLAPVHGRQLLKYLRLTKQPLGLLINFDGETFKEGVKRVANNHASFAPLRLCVKQTADVPPAGE